MAERGTVLQRHLPESIGSVYSYTEFQRNQLTVYEPFSHVLRGDGGVYATFTRQACVTVGNRQAWFEIISAQRDLPNPETVDVEFALAHPLQLVLGDIHNEQRNIFYQYVTRPTPNTILIRPFGPHENTLHDGVPPVLEAEEIRDATKHLLDNLYVNYPLSKVEVPDNNQFEQFLQQHEFSPVYIANNGVRIGRERILTVINRAGKVVDRYIRLAQVPIESDGTEQEYTYIYLISNVPTEPLPGEEVTLEDVDIRADTYCDCQKYGAIHEEHSCGHELLLTLERADAEGRNAIIASGIGDDFRGHGATAHVLAYNGTAPMEDIRDTLSLGRALAAMAEANHIQRARISGANSKKNAAIENAMKENTQEVEFTTLGNEWMENGPSPYLPLSIVEIRKRIKAERAATYTTKAQGDTDTFRFPEPAVPLQEPEQDIIDPATYQLSSMLRWIMADTNDHLSHLPKRRLWRRNQQPQPVLLGNNLVAGVVHGEAGIFPVEFADGQATIGQRIDQDHQALALALSRENLEPQIAMQYLLQNHFTVKNFYA